jgi:hypothetical protein
MARILALVSGSRIDWRGVQWPVGVFEAVSRRQDLQESGQQSHSTAVGIQHPRRRGRKPPSGHTSSCPIYANRRHTESFFR